MKMYFWQPQKSLLRRYDANSGLCLAYMTGVAYLYVSGNVCYSSLKSIPNDERRETAQLANLPGTNTQGNGNPFRKPGML